MKTMELTTTRTINAGGKRYYCPWGDYSNTSYWRTYGHAIACAYRRGWFTIPIAMIRAGIKLR